MEMDLITTELSFLLNSLTGIRNLQQPSNHKSDTPQPARLKPKMKQESIGKYISYIKLQV
jgi:hypothetical protein